MSIEFRVLNGVEQYPSETSTCRCYLQRPVVQVSCLESICFLLWNHFVTLLMVRTSPTLLGR
jgi:hypothetical protein